MRRPRQRRRPGSEGQDLIRHGDVGERDERHPEDVEQRDRDADRFGAEPIEPAEPIFALLLAGQPPAPGSKRRQCFLKICKPPYAQRWRWRL